MPCPSVWLPTPTIPTGSPRVISVPRATAATTGSIALTPPVPCSIATTGLSATSPTKLTTPSAGAVMVPPTSAARSTPRCPAVYLVRGARNGSRIWIGEGTGHAQVWVLVAVLAEDAVMRPVSAATEGTESVRESPPATAIDAVESMRRTPTAVISATATLRDAPTISSVFAWHPSDEAGHASMSHEDLVFEPVGDRLSFGSGKLTASLYSLGPLKEVFSPPPHVTVSAPDIPR